MKCVWVGSVQRMPSCDQVTSLVLSSDGHYVGCHVRCVAAFYHVLLDIMLNY